MSVLTGLLWAMAGKIEAFARQIWDEDQSYVRTSPITQKHVAIHKARQSDRSEFTMPNDNTTRQAQFLDERREEEGHKEGEGVSEERNRKKIWIKINGC